MNLHHFIFFKNAAENILSSSLFFRNYLFHGTATQTDKKTLMEYEIRGYRGCWVQVWCSKRVPVSQFLKNKAETPFLSNFKLKTTFSEHFWLFGGVSVWYFKNGYILCVQIQFTKKLKISDISAHFVIIAANTSFAESCERRRQLFGLSIAVFSLDQQSRPSRKE